MLKSFLHSLKNVVLLRPVERSLDADDIVGRQRLFLFRWFTLLAVWTCAGMFTEIYITIPLPLMQSMPIIAVAFIANYFLLLRHKNRKLAYYFLITAILFEIHLTSYFLGGVRNNGWFFSASTLLAAFMLLGTRAGFFYSAFVMLNQFYFYFITENTNWVSNMMENASLSVINLDYLITGSLSLVVISLQLIGLESSKNRVLYKLNQSKQELKEKNKKLKESEEELADYLRNSEAANEKLEQKNKDLDRFAYLVSHDLKAPLRAINSMTKFIEEDAAEKLPSETHNYLQIIRGRVTRMERLISDILSYSQATRSNKTFTEFTLKELVHDTIDLIILPDQCKIKVQGGDSIITSDKTRLGQLMLNLLVNAIKHHHNKEAIEINISAADEIQHWHLSVMDNGPGVPKEHHERIFQIFQTLNKKEDSESSGIGLAIVKKIVEDLQGKIWIESEPGKGTAFHFTLPKEKIKLPEQEATLAVR